MPSLQLDSSSYLNRINQTNNTTAINSYPELLQAENNLRDAINLFEKCTVTNNEIPFVKVSNYQQYYLAKPQTLLNDHFSNEKFNYPDVILNKEDSIVAELDKICDKLHKMKTNSEDMQTEILPTSNLNLMNCDQFQLNSQIILPKTIITKTAENEFQLSKLVISPPPNESSTSLPEQNKAIDKIQKTIKNDQQTHPLYQPVIKPNHYQHSPKCFHHLPVSNVPQNQHQKSIILDTEKYQQLVSPMQQQCPFIYENHNIMNNDQYYQIPRQYSSLPTMSENTFEDKLNKIEENTLINSRLMALIDYHNNYIRNKNSVTNNMSYDIINPAKISSNLNEMMPDGNKNHQQTNQQTNYQNVGDLEVNYFLQHLTAGNTANNNWLFRRSMSLDHIDSKLFGPNNEQNHFNIKSIEKLNSNNPIQQYPLSNNVSIIENGLHLNPGSAQLVQYLKPPIPPCLPSIKEKRLRQREIQEIKHQIANLNPGNKTLILSTINHSPATSQANPKRYQMEPVVDNNAIYAKQISSSPIQSSLNNTCLSLMDNKSVNSLQPNQIKRFPNFYQQIQQLQQQAHRQHQQNQPAQLENESGLFVANSSSGSSSPMLGKGNRSPYQLFGQNDFLYPYSECRTENNQNINNSADSCDGCGSLSGHTGAGDSSASFGSISSTNIDGLSNSNQILNRNGYSSGSQYDILESKQNCFQTKEMERLFSQCQYDIDTLLARLEEVHEKRISKYVSTNTAGQQSNNHPSNIDLSSLKAKESLILESRNFVISSKLFVKCAMEGSFQLIDYLTECVGLLERMFTVTEDFIMIEVNSPAQISCLVDRLKEVAATYAYTVDVVRRLVNHSNHEEINPYLDLLMSHATSLATSLTTLMRTLRSMN